MKKSLFSLAGLAALTSGSRLALRPGSQKSKSETQLPYSGASAARPAAAIPADINLVEWDDLEPGKGPVYGQGWSPEGRLLVTADYDVLRVWDRALRREVGVLAGHTDFIWGVAWSPAGDGRLASCSQDGSLRLWERDSLSELARLETGAAYCLAWSPDGRELAAGTRAGEVQVWDAAGKRRITLENPTGSAVLCLSWSPEGGTIAAGEVEGAIRLWDRQTGRLRATLAGGSPGWGAANGAAWSPDGSELACAYHDGRVRVWAYPSLQPARTILAHNGWARGLAWSPYGRLLASGGEDKYIRLWETSSGQIFAQEKHNFLPVWSVSWSPDGEKVASGAGAFGQPHTGATVVWDVPAQARMIQ